MMSSLTLRDGMLRLTYLFRIDAAAKHLLAITTGVQSQHYRCVVSLLCRVRYCPIFIGVCCYIIFATVVI